MNEQTFLRKPNLHDLTPYAREIYPGPPPYSLVEQIPREEGFNEHL